VTDQVNHIVLMRWKDGTSEADIARTSELAQALLTDVPGVLAMTDGPSVSIEGIERGYDYALLVRFDSLASRDAYLPHPTHQTYVDHISPIAAEVLVFDLLTPAP
jgi:hypothetical protein